MKNIFISNGDFVIPFNWTEYLFRHFYLWSENTSALSLDGILRLFSKSETILFYLFTDSTLFTGYFYILFCFIFSTCSIYVFLRKFLNVSQYSAMLGSILFLINPAFLGNYTKTGLVLSVSALPLALVCLKYFYEKKHLKYLIYVVFLLNISLLHPFTFAVNTLVLVLYAGYKYKQTLSFQYITKIIASGFIFLLFSLYFILPLLSLGTVSKDSIQNNFTKGEESVDYTQIVDVANTNGYLDGLIMSKNVFLDFDFYPKDKETIFFFGSYALLVLIFTFFLFKKNTRKEYIVFLILTLCFLILVTLTAVKTESIADTIKWSITNVPGGWAFRSPLKWQLYIPICLAGMLALSVNGLHKYRSFIGFSLISIIFITNSYILLDIKEKLLTPKSLGVYKGIYTNLVGADNLLIIRNSECIKSTTQYDASIINQMSSSITGGVYSVTETALETIPIFSFDYVLSCVNNPKHTESNFSEIESVANFKLYKNIFPITDVEVFSQIYSFENNLNYKSKSFFLRNELETKKIYFESSGTLPGEVSIFDIFENISSVNIDKTNNNILDTLPENVPNDVTTYEVANNLTGTLQKKENGHYVYQNLYNSYKNILANHSFEEGLWQEKVADCHSYDENPIINMSLNSEEKTDGEQSLQLEATRHVACASRRVDVIGGSTYLFSFDYQSPNANHSAYYLGFDDETKTNISEDIPVTSTDWETFSKTINVPEGATEMSIYVYADSVDEKTNIINRYDNFQLIEIPDLSDAFYLVSEPDVELVDPREVTFDLINPTKKMVHIKGATTPFYLAMSESYHPQWQLQFTNEKIQGFFKSWVPFVKPDKVPDEQHLKLNDFLNGWYVDVDVYCRENTLCTQNPDGSYDMEMTVEFFPQRWFYLGLLISGTTLVGCVSYLVYEGVESIRRRKKKHEKDTI